MSSGNRNEGNHAFSKICVDSKHMVLCTDHDEYHMPNVKCGTCLNIIESAARRAKKADEKAKKKKEKELVPCKANNWDWSLAIQPLTKPFKKGNENSKRQGDGKGKCNGKGKGKWGHTVL